MSNYEALNEIKRFVYERFQEEPTGHDYWHMERVAQTAKHIASKEGGDLFVVEVAGWLHDVSDKKLVKNAETARNDVKELLIKAIPSPAIVKQILTAMEDVSFRGSHTIPQTLEGKIVQDADRLDAIGAIGIARTFAYGGNKGQLIHSEPNEFKEEKCLQTSIQHFYDKLLRLKNLMNTKAAIDLAEERHVFMEKFLEQFYKEWKRP